MKTNAKSNLKKLVVGLNEMAKEELKFNQKGEKKVKTLEQRQSVVNADLERIYGTNLNKEGGVKKTMKKQDVVTKVKEVKAANVTPVDLEQVEAQAKKFLGEFAGEFNGAEIEEVRTIAYHIKLKSNILIGVKCLVANGKVSYHLVVPESLKNFSDTLKGTYPKNNWMGEFPIADNTKKYTPIVKNVVGKFLAKPVAKVVVAKVANTAPKKKVKPIVKTI